MGTDERRTYSDLAPLVVGGLSDALVGRSHDGAQIVTVFHYGAVDIDPKHLVVWILVDGPRSDEVPEWLSVSPLLQESLRPEYPDYAWLLSVRAEVVSAFEERGWPDASAISVMVDSEPRVAAGGGWFYFK